jgi:exodeoxyribonuclease VII large subunit
VQDFVRILTRRGWRGRLIVLPARVQGEGAAGEMVAMLALAHELAIFDLLVIGRGGGSLEDLWAFNEELLVRAIVGSLVPVISAVGHEIDFTLCDFGADVRAETPSGAAELISSHFVNCAERVLSANAAMTSALESAVERARERLDHARSRLRLLTPAGQIEQGYLRLDDFSNRLVSALRSTMQLRRQRLGDARARLAQASPEARIQLNSHQLLSLYKRLQAASPASVLNRGFVIMRDEKGKPISRRSSVSRGQRLAAEFHDGSVPVRAEE